MYKKKFPVAFCSGVGAKGVHLDTGEVLGHLRFGKSRSVVARCVEFGKGVKLPLRDGWLLARSVQG